MMTITRLLLLIKSMKYSRVDISTISTFYPIQTLPYCRNKLVIHSLKSHSTFRISSSLARVILFRFRSNRIFLWVDPQKGIIRDKDHNYFVVTKVRQPDRKGNKQLLLWGDDWDLYNDIR